MSTKVYRQSHKKEIKEQRKEYRQRPEVIKHRKAYRQRPEVKKRHRNKMRKYYQSSKGKAYIKEYYSRPEVIKMVREYQNNYVKKRRKEDPSFRTRLRLRRRLVDAFDNFSINGKKYNSKKYGINFTAIIKELKPFPKDIENHQIDHIIPLSLFDFNNLQEIKWAFAPENHQWLTKEENMKKGNREIMVKI